MNIRTIITTAIMIMVMGSLTGCSEDVTGPIGFVQPEVINIIPEDNLIIPDIVPTNCTDCSDEIINIRNEYGTPDNTSYINSGDYWKWVWRYYNEDGQLTDTFTFEEDPSTEQCCGFIYQKEH